VKTIFLVKSQSREEPYAIVVSSTPEHGVTISCDCPSGCFKRYCKHKSAVLAGNNEVLFDSDQQEQFSIALTWIKDTAFPELIIEVFSLQEYLVDLEEIVQNARDDYKSALMRYGSSNLKCRNLENNLKIDMDKLTVVKSNLRTRKEKLAYLMKTGLKNGDKSH